jgi:chemotaxis protein MotB
MNLVLAQLIAAGRSSYIPLVENDSAENRARNRRTRIVVLLKLINSTK